MHGWDCVCGQGDAALRWDGEYQAAGDKCVRKPEAEATDQFYQESSSIDYQAVQRSTTAGESKISGYSLATSDTFARLQLQAAVGCFTITRALEDGAPLRDIKSCQVLANLCVLQLYS